MHIVVDPKVRRLRLQDASRPYSVIRQGDVARNDVVVGRYATLEQARRRANDLNKREA